MNVGFIRAPTVAVLIVLAVLMPIIQLNQLVR
jgi:type II secretory pathway component PulF